MSNSSNLFNQYGNFKRCCEYPSKYLITYQTGKNAKSEFLVCRKCLDQEIWNQFIIKKERLA